MEALNEQYVIDDEGNRKAVIVPITEWEKILEALEELDDILAYDEAKSEASDPVPFDKVVNELNRK